jgi:hypothetical protein
MATEVVVREDGSMLAVAERDWTETLLDACSVKLLGQLADEDTTYDIYEVQHQDGQVRTYALEV